MKKSRGRPRNFDSEEALGNALLVFWTKGFANTSLDDLAGAMQMKRPSIYNAFGDKKSLYRAALRSFSDRLADGLAALAESTDPEVGLQQFFIGALDVYMSGEQALGCLIFCTAPAEMAVADDVREDILTITVDTDKALKRVFDDAQRSGRISAAADTLATAQMTQAILHSLALRARAGQSRATLNRMARHAAKVLCA